MEDNVERVQQFQEMLEVIQEVIKERHHQNQKWGGPTHDDEHYTSDWCVLLDNRTRRLQWPDDIATKGGDNRRLLIEIAALAVAAVESMDRKSSE